MEEDKKKRGRPKKPGSLDVRLPGIRVTGEEALRLRNASKRSGMSQADIQRLAMEKFILEIEKIYPEGRYEAWEEEYFEDYEDEN